MIRSADDGADLFYTQIQQNFCTDSAMEKFLPFHDLILVLGCINICLIGCTAAVMMLKIEQAVFPADIQKNSFSRLSDDLF